MDVATVYIDDAITVKKKRAIMHEFPPSLRLA